MVPAMSTKSLSQYLKLVLPADYESVSPPPPPLPLHLTCSVSPVSGCEGLWSYDYGCAWNEYTLPVDVRGGNESSVTAHSSSVKYLVQVSAERSGCFWSLRSHRFSEVKMLYGVVGGPSQG